MLGVSTPKVDTLSGLTVANFTDVDVTVCLVAKMFSNTVDYNVSLIYNYGRVQW